jgi:hypothetical protein
MFKKIKDKAPKVPKADIPDVEVPKNPVDDEMINEIKGLLEEYIPRFINLYTDKLKELVKEKNKKIVKNKKQVKEKKEKKEEETDEEKKKEILEEIELLEIEINETLEELRPVPLNLETIKELGLDEIKEAITKFIMTNVGSKIEAALPAGETVREKGMELAEKAIAKLVDEAVSKIDDLIGELMEKVLKEEEEAAEAELEEVDEVVEEPVEETIEEIIEEPADKIAEEPVEEIVEEVVHEPVETMKREVEEEPAEPVEEVIEEVVQEVYGETAKIDTVEVDREKAEVGLAESGEVPDLDSLKDVLVNKILKTYGDKIKSKFSDDWEAQQNAMGLFKERIETIVEDTIAKKKKTNKEE